MQQTLRPQLVFFLAVALWLVIFLPTASRAASSDRSEPEKVDAAILRMKVMRYTDRWTSKIDNEINEISQYIAPAEDRYNFISLKLISEIEAVDIAAGPIPAINALDMGTFITVTRLAIEYYWLPKITDHEKGAELLTTMEKFEAEAWEIAGDVLPGEKVSKLRRYIVNWYGQEHGVWHGKGARVSVYLADIGMTLKDESGGSLFLPEISSMTSSVDEIRILGERMMYYLQRINIILYGQANLLLLKSLKRPEVVKLLADTHRVSLAAESLADTAKELPDTLEAKSETLHSLMQQAESLSTRLDATLTTLGTTLKLYQTTFPAESSVEKMNQFKLILESLDKLLAKSVPVLADINQILASPEAGRKITQLTSAAGQLKEEASALVNLIARDVVLVIVAFFVCLLAYKLILRSQARKNP